MPVASSETRHEPAIAGLRPETHLAASCNVLTPGETHTVKTALANHPQADRDTVSFKTSTILKVLSLRPAPWASSLHYLRMT